MNYVNNYYSDRYERELNDQQKKVIDHVLENRRHVRHSAVPFILYGPFGTGKTLTLAEAAKAAVFCAPQDSRILICTHSNRYSALEVSVVLLFYQLVVLKIYHITGSTSGIVL